MVRKIRNPKRGEAQQRLGPWAGVSNAGLKRAARELERATLLRGIQPQFEIKVTARASHARLRPARNVLNVARRQLLEPMLGV